MHSRILVISQNREYSDYIPTADDIIDMADAQRAGMDYVSESDFSLEEDEKAFSNETGIEIVDHAFELTEENVVPYVTEELEKIKGLASKVLDSSLEEFAEDSNSTFYNLGQELEKWSFGDMYLYDLDRDYLISAKGFLVETLRYKDQPMKYYVIKSYNYHW